MIVAGIDGGQSSTVAVVCDAAGAVLGRGVGPPADEVGETAGSRKTATACERALAEAMRVAELPAGSPLDAVVIGLSGYHGRLRGAMPSLGTARVRLMHDAPIALAGATRMRPAVVVIAGTGSVAYGEDAYGASFQVGGWGPIFGDDGASFALARDALAGAMRASDRGHPVPLGEAALAFFDLPDLRAVQDAVAAGALSRARLAGFARLVHNAARHGDADAAILVEASAAALASLAGTAVDRLRGDADVTVAFVGGALNDPEHRMRVEDRARRAHPRAVVIAPEAEPAVGAARLALADAAAA